MTCSAALKPVHATSCRIHACQEGLLRLTTCLIAWSSCIQPCQKLLTVQYVVEARYTGEEHELVGAAQQQIVGHKERYIPGVPINYANNDLYQ